MSGPRASMSRCSGAALLLVLWIIVLLTGLIAVFALTARTEGLQGRYLGRSVAARGAAEAGVEVAAMHLQGLDPAQRWIPDGRSNQFDFEGHQVQVRVVDEGGKVDLNFAPPELLVGLLTAVGVEQDKSRALSGAIQDWRDEDDLVNLEGGAEDSAYSAARLPYGAKDRPFEAVSELRLVLGMDEALYRKLAPYITLFSGQARPDPAYAAPVVLQALGLTPEQVSAALDQRQSATQPGSPLAAGGSGTYSISSRATRPDGTRVQVQAAIRMGGGGGFGQLYLPLSWRVGESD
jgi:general secretion pathway protein K